MNTVMLNEYYTMHIPIFYISMFYVVIIWEPAGMVHVSKHNGNIGSGEPGNVYFYTTGRQEGCFALVVHVSLGKGKLVNRVS